MSLTTWICQIFSTKSYLLMTIIYFLANLVKNNEIEEVSLKKDKKNTWLLGFLQTKKQILT